MSKPAKKSLAASPKPISAATPSPPTADDPARRGADAGSKQSRVIAMLRSPGGGATIAAMMKTTGWQPHSVRGFLAGVVRKRLKLKLASDKLDADRVYRIAGGGSGKSGSSRSKRRPV